MLDATTTAAPAGAAATTSRAIRPSNGTDQPVDLAALAAVHGLPVAEVDTAAGLMPALDDAVSAGGVRVVRVHTDRADNVTRHREVWATVADSLPTGAR